MYIRNKATKKRERERIYNCEKHLFNYSLYNSTVMISIHPCDNDKKMIIVVTSVSIRV